MLLVHPQSQEIEYDKCIRTKLRIRPDIREVDKWFNGRMFTSIPILPSECQLKLDFVGSAGFNTLQSITKISSIPPSFDQIHDDVFRLYNALPSICTMTPREFIAKHMLLSRKFNRVRSPIVFEFLDFTLYLFPKSYLYIVKGEQVLFIPLTEFLLFSLPGNEITLEYMLIQQNEYTRCKTNRFNLVLNNSDVNSDLNWIYEDEVLDRCCLYSNEDELIFHKFKDDHIIYGQRDKYEFRIITYGGTSSKPKYTMVRTYDRNDSTDTPKKIEVRKDDIPVYTERNSRVLIDLISEPYKDRDTIGWKAAKLATGEWCILKLRIPAGAEIVFPLDDDYFRTYRKHRCSYADVLEIQAANIDREETLPNQLAYPPFYSDRNTLYLVGNRIHPDTFDKNKFKSCAPGIHFHYERRYAFTWIFPLEQSINCDYTTPSLLSPAAMDLHHRLPRLEE